MLIKENFNERQLEIINYAEQLGEDAKEAYNVLTEHPEYSSELMQMIIDSVLKDETFNDLIELSEISRVEKGKEKGKYGGFNLLYNYNSFKKFGYIEKAKNELKADSNVSMNKLLYNAICHAQNTDRPALTGILAHSSDYRDAVMSEGDDKIAKILDTILYHSGDLDVANAKRFESGFMGSHMQLGKENINILDNMNIRGKQIEYALEYCDNDIQTFVKKIQAHSQEMIDYINQKTVEKYSNPDRPMYKAVNDRDIFESDVTGYRTEIEAEIDMLVKKISHRDIEVGRQSESEHKIYPIINPNEKDDYKKRIEPLTIEYNNREIINGTSLNEAVEILKAHGFEEVCKIPRENYFNEEVFHLVMHNPNTGAIADAPVAQEDNICYGGMSITVPTSERYGLLGKEGLEWLQAESNYVEKSGIFYTSVSEHHEIMRSYRAVIGDEAYDIDTNKLGYGYDGIPILLKDKYEDVTMKRTEDFKYPHIGRLLYSQGYRFSDYMNHLSMDESINYVSPDKQYLYDKYFENRYSETLKYFCLDVNRNAPLLGAAFRISGISAEEVDNYYECAMEMASNHHENYREQIIKDLEACRDDFYGVSRTVRDFIDEFGFEVPETKKDIDEIEETDIDEEER